MARTRYPTIVIDSPVAEHFEILCRMRCLGLGIVKCVNEGSSIERPLLRTVYHLRERKTRRFQCGRSAICYIRTLETTATPGSGRRVQVRSDHESPQAEDGHEW